MAMRSAFYEGKVRHRRFSPKAHDFDYSLFMAGINLDEIDKIGQLSHLWSYNRRNLMEFRRSDYLPDEPGSLKQAVVGLLQQHTGENFDGEVVLLTHPRSFGFCFNPVSFYFCYEEGDDQPSYILAQINNTPWNERHVYVLSVDQAENNQNSIEFAFDKDFTVSPFMPMDIAYRWVFSLQEKNLLIHMECKKDNENVFDATMTMEKHAFTSSKANSLALTYPLMCFKVVAGIYWQALLLYLKRSPFYGHQTLKQAPSQIPSQIRAKKPTIEVNNYANHR